MQPRLPPSHAGAVTTHLYRARPQPRALPCSVDSHGQTPIQMGVGWDPGGHLLIQSTPVATVC